MSYKECLIFIAELLAQITDDNCHAEVDTGPAVGSEVWWD